MILSRSDVSGCLRLGSDCLRVLQLQSKAVVDGKKRGNSKHNGAPSGSADGSQLHTSCLPAVGAGCQRIPFYSSEHEGTRHPLFSSSLFHLPSGSNQRHPSSSSSQTLCMIISHPYLNFLEAACQYETRQGLFSQDG